MLYASGLFRKPLRFAVRRAVVNAPTWRPGAYLVLDTGTGRGRRWRRALLVLGVWAVPQAILYATVDACLQRHAATHPMPD